MVQFNRQVVLVIIMVGLVVNMGGSVWLNGVCESVVCFCIRFIIDQSSVLISGRFVVRQIMGQGWDLGMGLQGKCMNF